MANHSTANRRAGIKLPKKYPAPQFSIGDKVVERWNDEFGKDCIEYGEVAGICWHPLEQTWTYLINWTSGEGSEICYPCFDQQLVIGRDLRRVG